jgi:hypothetical protein
MRKRFTPALVAVLLVGAAVMQSATAASKGTSVPKFYAASASPTVVPLPLPVAPAAPATVSVVLTNCLPCDGVRSSTQSFGSAQIRFPASAPLSTALGTVGVDRAHWTAAVVPGAAGETVLELGNSGTGTTDAVPPGAALTVTLTVTTPTPGAIPFVTQVKQSNDFSGNGNDFGRSGLDPTVYIGSRPATHLEFVTQPTSVQGTGQAQGTGATPILTTCPSVRALDTLGNLATSFTGTVTLTPAAADPGLAFAGTTQVGAIAAVATAGLATFDTDSGTGCAGLSATNLGFGYTLTASSGTLATDTSDPFDVLQFYASCGASCATPTIKGAHGTTASAHATSTSTDTDPLTFDVGQRAWQPYAGICNPDVGAAGSNPYREAVTIDLGAHDKTVTLLWSKQAVQWAINNGASQWRVCLAATFAFPAVGGPAAGPLDDGFYVGALLPCGSVGLTATDPCLQKLNKSGGQQQALVLLPLRPGDPKMY